MGVANCATESSAVAYYLQRPRFNPTLGYWLSGVRPFPLWPHFLWLFQFPPTVGTVNGHCKLPLVQNQIMSVSKGREWFTERYMGKTEWRASRDAMGQMVSNVIKKWERTPSKSSRDTAWPVELLQHLVSFHIQISHDLIKWQCKLEHPRGANLYVHMY